MTAETVTLSASPWCLLLSASAALALLTLSAVLQGTYRMLVKTSGDRVVLLGAANLVSVVAGVVGVVFVGPLPAVTWPYLVASAGAYSAAMLAMAAGYRRVDLSVVGPQQEAFGVLFVAAFSVPVFGELIGWQHAAGFLLLVVGVVIAQPLRAAVGERLRVLGWATLFGALIGCVWLIDFAAVRTVEDPFVYIVYNLMIGLPLVGWVAVTRRRTLREAVRRQLVPIAASAGLDIAAYGIILWVVHTVRVAEVLPVVNLRIAVIALLGVVVLREPDTARRVAAASVLALGAAVANLA